MGALQTSTATQSVAQSMGTATEAMAAVGKVNDPAAIQKIMQSFQRENMKAEMAGEMMEDALDSAFDTEEADGEADDIMNEVVIFAPLDCSPVAYDRLAFAWAIFDLWWPVSLLRMVDFSLPAEYDRRL